MAKNPFRRHTLEFKFKYSFEKPTFPAGLITILTQLTGLCNDHDIHLPQTSLTNSLNILFIFFRRLQRNISYFPVQNSHFMFFSFKRMILVKGNIDFFKYGYLDRWNFIDGWVKVSASKNLLKRFLVENNKRKYEDKFCYLLKMGVQRSVECSV